MDEEVAERKRAMELYHVEQMSKVAICRKLKRSRPWLDHWLRCYDPGDIEGSLRDHRERQGKRPSKWSGAVQRQVLQTRKQRSQEEQWRYAYKGAEAIHWELKVLESAEVPPVRTIHAWFQAAGLVDKPKKEPTPREEKVVPIPTAERVNRVQQLDLKGPIYLTASRAKYYLVVVRDRYSQRCAIDVLDKRDAQGIVIFLVAAWGWLGLPDYLQVDNALEFRGSNRYPRSFGRFVRCAVDLGVEVLFNPPRQPWRNGGVEWFNSFLASHLLKVPFTDLAAFRSEAHRCQEDCNQLHRLSHLDGATPNEVSSRAALRLPPPDYQRHLLKQLPQDHGFVSFVRKVRKSGRITLGNGDRFMVDPALAHQYVLARVDLTLSRVSISYQETLLQVYDFSPATVGKWAGIDQQQPEERTPENEVVKVPD